MEFTDQVQAKEWADLAIWAGEDRLTEMKRCPPILIGGAAERSVGTVMSRTVDAWEAWEWEWSQLFLFLSKEYPCMIST